MPNPDNPTMHVTIHEDNSGALILATTLPPQFTTRSKHYAIKTVWFRDNNLARKIKVMAIETRLQLGDIFTKMPAQTTFEFVRKLLIGWWLIIAWEGVSRVSAQSRVCHCLENVFVLIWPLISLFSLICHIIGDSNLNFESQFEKGGQPMRNNSIFQTGTCWKDPTWTEIDFGKIYEIFLLGSLVFLCNHQPCFQDSFFGIFGKKGRNIWGAMSSSDRINDQL